MADILADTLRPWVGGGFLDYTQRPEWMPEQGWHNYKTFGGHGFAAGGDRVDAFNPAESLYLMKAYNDTYSLGLTDEEIAAGINKFGQWHQNRFNSKLVADSSAVAVAAQSLAEAMSLKGQDGYGSAFWQDIGKPGGDLERGAKEAVARGEAALAEIKKRTDTASALFGSSLYTQIPYSNGGDSFGDFLMAAAPLVMAGVVGASALGWGGLAGAAEAGASLGSGISSGAGGVTGISAGAGGATGVTGSVAGLSGGVLAPATTGGLLVGSEGFLGSTGNAIGDQVLNSAGQNAIKSAVTGGDPLQGAVQGAVGGAIGASGIGAGAADLVGATGDAATAITTGVNAAAGSGAMTAINGGSFADILENSAISGVSQGAGSYVSNALDSGSNAIDRGVGGAVAGGTNAALTGGDIGTGLLTSGLAGAAGGLATDLGASPAVSGVVQGVTGGIVNSALQPDAVVNPPPDTGTTPAAPDVSSISFGDVVPHFVDVSRSTEWGNRLKQAGRI